MIGFLSPDGNLYECESDGYLDLAVELCNKLYEENFRIAGHAAVHLLNNGWLSLAASNAFMNYYNENMEHILLSADQLQWLEDNKNSLDKMQKRDISEYLESQDYTKTMSSYHY